MAYIFNTCTKDFVTHLKLTAFSYSADAGQENQPLFDNYKFSYLRTKDNAEIDLIIERPGLPIALVEIKSAYFIDETHVATVQKFAYDIGNSEAFCLSLDKNSKKIGTVSCLYWMDGVKELGLSGIIG